MNKIYKLLLFSVVIAIFTSCTYTFPEDEAPTAGSADFSKVVAVGNSLTAGYMNGALYDEGQMASFANIVATQIQLNGGGEFNQPDINAVDGDFGGTSGGAAGRLHLVNPASPAPAPIIPGQPITAYSGGNALNNFGVPGMRIIDVALEGYGVTNGYFGRFASNPATASVQGDAIAASGSFIMFWLGSNDALGYALGGATIPAALTDVAVFDQHYKNAINGLFNSGQKGILANIPSVSSIPHFTTVPWNAIEFDESDPVDAGTIAALNAGYATYNGTLDQLVGIFPGFTQEEADRRKIVFADGANGIVIFDNTLTDITSIDPALVNMRMTTSTDLITLTAGAVLPTGIGVSSPLGEEYTLILADQELIANRIADFNAIILSVVDGSGGDLALLDINTIFAEFTQNGAVINGSGMDATIVPPFGAFSLDGVHPNPRGAAFVASLFIEQINAAFGANIPNVNPNDWPGNELPVP